jgi:hypothetical protein
MPVMFIWTLKFVTSAIVGDTDSVKIAVWICPGVSLVFSWFHVRVMGPFADDGFQLVVFMLRVSERPLPVFLM